jgi:glycosyltransferase involved in cell wall biosynthesis
MQAKPDISIIVPVYNEGIAVNHAFEVISNVMEEAGVRYEIIMIDDGSSDDSFYYLNELAKTKPQLKVIKLLSNCGAHSAIRLGLEYANGRMGVFIACDLQEPADLIPKMMDKMVDKTDIVLAVRVNRDDSLKDKLFSKLFFFIMKNFVSDKIPLAGSSMYLLGEKGLKAIKEYKERNMTIEGIFILNNLKFDTIEYSRDSRKTGISKWTLAKKIKIFIDFFVAYSITPIRFVSIIGFLFFIFGGLWFLFIIIQYFINGDLQHGWTSIISILLLGFGITNISLGIIAEYLWRTLDEARGRPRYIIDKKVNFE